MGDLHPRVDLSPCFLALRRGDVYSMGYYRPYTNTHELHLSHEPERVEVREVPNFHVINAKYFTHIMFAFPSPSP